jgi:hypothetical protein
MNSNDIKYHKFQLTRMTYWSNNELMSLLMKNNQMDYHILMVEWMDTSDHIEHNDVILLKELVLIWATLYHGIYPKRDSTNYVLVTYEYLISYAYYYASN